MKQITIENALATIKKQFGGELVSILDIETQGIIDIIFKDYKAVIREYYTNEARTQYLVYKIL